MFKPNGCYHILFQLDTKKHLKDIAVTVNGKDTTLGILMNTMFSYRTCIPGDQEVEVYKAVIDEQGNIINVGDSFAYVSSTAKVNSEKLHHHVHLLHPNAYTG